MLSPQTLHQEFDPPESLVNAIKCFWYDKVELKKGQLSFDVVPDGYVELIFHFASPCSVLRDGILEPLPSPFMMGLLNQTITFYIKSTLEIIAVRCYPWAVFDLIGVTSGKEQVCGFDHPLVHLQPVLAECIHAGQREKAIMHLNDFFLNQTLQDKSGGLLTKAGSAMTKANGTLPVSEVAEAAHTTVRTLERNFKKSSGHTVKDVSGLMRFEQARNQLLLHPDSNLAALAHELGYADQAHLSKAFKRYSGSSPAAFARNAKQGNK